MMPTAHSRSLLSGRENRVSRGTIEDAAKYLSVLVYRSGWEGDAVGSLLRGDRITHKGFEFWVDSEEEERQSKLH
jgi:hypothetical protein